MQKAIAGKRHRRSLSVCSLYRVLLGSLFAEELKTFSQKISLIYNYG